MKESATIFLMLVIVVVAGPGAYATLFINPPEDGRGCAISDYGYGQQDTDNFALISDAMIHALRWWGAYGSSPDPVATDDFTVRFFNDAGGAPTNTPFKELSILDLSRTATDMTASVWGAHDGGRVYEYLAELPETISADGGVTYYVAIVNNTESDWGWLEDGDGVHWYGGGSSSWSLSIRNTDLSFELIPEPATLLLLGFGGLALARKHG